MALTAPTRLFGNACQSPISVEATNIEFNEINGTYTATSISLGKLTPGTYQMIFLVNGIESERTQSFTIIETTDVISVFPPVFEAIWSTGVFALLVIFNAVIFSKFCFLISILAVLLEIAVCQQASQGTFFQVICYLILSLISFLIILELFGEIRNEKRAGFDNSRKEVFRTYTKQIFWSNFRRKECQVFGTREVRSLFMIFSQWN